MQAAARVFFDKPAKDLTLTEAALLAGLPQAPTDYNPLLNPRGAKERRDEVLRAMAAQGMITPAQLQEALDSGLGVEQSRYYTQRRENYVFDYVRSELIDRYGVDTVRSGGLKIHTTIDLDLQKEARGAMSSILNQPGDPASAIVTIDPANGHILAMASSGSYGRSKFNLAAQGRRQPGSTFKTMVLMTALRQGVDPDRTFYVSKPLKFDDPTYGPIDVATYSNSYIGSPTWCRPPWPPTTPSTSSWISTSGPTRSSRPPRTWASRPSSTATPPRGWAACSRRLAPGDGQRVRDDRQRRLPQPAHRHHQGRLATARSTSSARASARRCSATASPPRRPTSCSRTSRPARARRRTSAVRRRARPAPPTTSATRGSSASRRSWPPPSGSATPTSRPRWTRCTGSRWRVARSRPRSGPRT